MPRAHLPKPPKPRPTGLQEITDQLRFLDTAALTAMQSLITTYDRISPNWGERLAADAYNIACHMLNEHNIRRDMTMAAKKTPN